MPIFTTSDGVRLAYECFGPYKGKPFILVHGFASTYAVNWVYTGWVNLLVERGYRVVVFDNRGHGNSDKPIDIASYAMERLTQDVVELAESLDIQKAYLMGYSMGGMITLMACALYPQFWEKGIAAGVGANLLQGGSQMGPVVTAFLTPNETERATMAAENPTVKMFYDFAQANQQDFKALGTCLAAIPRPFPFATLPPIRTPILLILGNQDTHTGPADALLGHILAAQLVYIPGRDHSKAVGDTFYKQCVIDFVSDKEGDIVAT